jgi:hypothetical protein
VRLRDAVAMLWLLLGLAVVALAVPGCAELATYGASAAEHRRTMNDLQARLTMASMCDVSLGAYHRELNEAERQLVTEVCGGGGLDASQSRVLSKVIAERERQRIEADKLKLAAPDDDA